MAYTNTFISQSNPLDFLTFLHDYLLNKNPQAFSFELIFSGGNEETESDSHDFFEKYRDDIKTYQFADQEVLSFDHSSLKNLEFIKDITFHLENEGFLTLSVFYDILDLAQAYENGFRRTVKNELFRFEIYKLAWEAIKLPNPYLYTDVLPEAVYQQMDSDYDLINLGQATLSLKKPLHIIFSLVSNVEVPDEHLFDKENVLFQRFNDIVDEISVQLCQ